MSNVHVKILKHAKKLISSGSITYVCIAIRRASDELGYAYYRIGSKSYKDKHTETYELLKFIEDHIQPYNYVNVWIREVHNIELDAEEQREYRLAWIDQMIEYWKDKE